MSIASLSQRCVEARVVVNNDDSHLSLVCRVHGKLCALPLQHVLETMRPLPTRSVAGAPHFVRGLAVIRGGPVPVIDAARLLGETDARADRFVTLALGARRVALAVGSVLGVRAPSQASLQALPLLLQQTGCEVVTQIGLLDAELLLVLQSSRLLTEDAWTALEAAQATV